MTATLALFIALGGGAYAAVHLPRNAVGPAQIRKGAVNGAKVKDGSLSAADLRAGTIPASVPTPLPTPPATQPTRQISPLRSGETMSGIVQLGAPNIEEQPRSYTVGASFPFPPAAPIPTANQHITNTPTADCPEQGLAAPGQLCLYEPHPLIGAKNPLILNQTGSGGEIGRAGFMVHLESTGVGLNVLFTAVWAYTAP